MALMQRNITVGNLALSFMDGKVTLSGSASGFLTGSAANQTNAGVIKYELTGTLQQVVSQSGGVDQYRFSSTSPDQRVMLQQGVMRKGTGQYQIFLDSNYAKLVSAQFLLDDIGADNKLASVEVYHDPTGDNFLLDGQKTGSLPNGNVGGQNASLAYSTVGFCIRSGSVVGGAITSVLVDPTGSFPSIQVALALTKDGRQGGV